MGQDSESLLKPGAVSSLSGTLVAIPCHNEELAIGSTVLLARKHSDTVLVVDDGSRDRTASVARAAGAEVVVHSQNAGKGAAVRSAFRYARDHGYHAMVLMDGDGQHNPAEITALLAPILDGEGEVDIALGFRFGAHTQMPAWRRVGKRVLDYATSASGGGEVTDSQCGFRAYGRRAIEVLSEDLKSDGFGVESEQLVVAKDKGLRWQNVPITCAYDDIDGSTKGPIAHAIEVLSDLVAIVTMRRPLLTIGIPSLALILWSVALAIRTIQFYNETHIFPIPSALASASLGLLGAFGVFSSLILNFVARLERAIAKNGRA